MSENEMVLAGIGIVFFFLSIVGVAWALAWGMVQRARTMPNLLAQVQEGAKLERSLLKETQKMLLAHCNKTAAYQYMEIEQALGPQENHPIPGHGATDRVNGTGDPIKALQSVMAQKQALEAKQRKAEAETRFGHLAGASDG